MTGSASALVEIQLASRMSIKKIRSMASWLQIHVFGVTLRATKGRIYFTVADQTVFHMRKIGLCQWPLNLRNSAMAGTTWVVGDQVCPQLQDVDFVRRPKILLAVDRTGNHWSQVAKAQVKGMIKVIQNLAPMLVRKTCRVFLLGVTSQALEFFLQRLLVRDLPMQKQRGQKQN